MDKPWSLHLDHQPDAGVSTHAAGFEITDEVREQLVRLAAAIRKAPAYPRDEKS